MIHILVVDDEPSIRETLGGILEDEGYRVTPAEDGESGLTLMRDQHFDVVLLDIWLPHMDGLAVLQEVKDLDDRPEVVMISGHGTVETAVRATKLGAYDFLEKPLSLDKTLIVVKNAACEKIMSTSSVIPAPSRMILRRRGRVGSGVFNRISHRF